MADPQKREPVKHGESLLEVRGLRTHFRGDEGIAKAVDGVNYTVLAGETLGIVGESGCGKSVTALSILGLVPQPPGFHAGGEILFRGEDLLQATEERMREIRGNDISMIFQEPMTALNPVFTVGNQIMETVMLHQGLDKDAARAHAIRMLDVSAGANRSDSAASTSTAVAALAGRRRHLGGHFEVA